MGLVEEISVGRGKVRRRLQSLSEFDIFSEKSETVSFDPVGQFGQFCSKTLGCFLAPCDLRLGQLAGGADAGATEKQKQDLRAWASSPGSVVECRITDVLSLKDTVMLGLS